MWKSSIRTVKTTGTKCSTTFNSDWGQKGKKSMLVKKTELTTIKAIFDGKMGKNSFSFIRALCIVHTKITIHNTKMDCISITNALERFSLIHSLSLSMCVLLLWCVHFFFTFSAQINHEYRYHLIVFSFCYYCFWHWIKRAVNKEQTNQVQRFSLSKWTTHNSSRFTATKTDILCLFFPRWRLLNSY